MSSARTLEKTQTQKQNYRKKIVHYAWRNGNVSLHGAGLSSLVVAAGCGSCSQCAETQDYSQISGILADNKIGIFAISTYNTDYVLTKKELREGSRSSERSWI